MAIYRPRATHGPPAERPPTFGRGPIRPPRLHPDDIRPEDLDPQPLFGPLQATVQAVLVEQGFDVNEAELPSYDIAWALTDALCRRLETLASAHERGLERPGYREYVQGFVDGLRHVRDLLVSNEDEDGQ